MEVSITSQTCIKHISFAFKFHDVLIFFITLLAFLNVRPYIGISTFIPKDMREIGVTNDPCTMSTTVEVSLSRFQGFFVICTRLKLWAPE